MKKLTSRNVNDHRMTPEEKALKEQISTLTSRICRVSNPDHKEQLRKKRDSLYHQLTLIEDFDYPC